MRTSGLLSLVLVGGCHFFVPDTRTPADRAREVAPRCQVFTEEAAAAVLSASLIDSVEPSYAHVQSGPSFYQAHLRGARIHLKPIGAVSRETIVRNLECHESRVVLGTTPAMTDDPYAVPGQWLDIDVDSEKDGFVVRSETDDMATAHDILDRARRFAAAATHAAPTH